MSARFWARTGAAVAAIALAAAACSLSSCSSSSSPPPAAPAAGRVVVALTIDWEGAYLSPDGLDTLEALRGRLGAVPLTHFISAAYFTKERPEPRAAAWITAAVREGDEVAVHLHGWRSLARAAGVEPRLSPSFLTGTDELLQFDDGDAGFDTDLDAYGVPELRALVRTSRRLLEGAGLRVSRSFRAGGYLGTPKVLQAIREEGFAVDSSATDHRQLDERKDEVLPRRIAAIWPGVETRTQPWLLPGSGPAGGAPLLELPIAAFADYATAAEIAAIIEAAHARLAQDRSRDVFVVLGFHLETAEEFAGRIGEALAAVRARPALAGDLVFATIAAAAERARPALGAAPAPAR